MLVKHKQLIKKGKTGFIMDAVEKGASNIIGGGITVIEGLNMPTTNQSTFTGVNDYSQARDAKFDRNMKIGKGLLQAGLGATGSPLAPLAGMVLDLFSSKGDCKYSLNGRCVSKEEWQKAKQEDWKRDNQLAVNRANANLQYIPTNTQLTMKAKKGARLYKKSVDKKQDGGEMPEFVKNPKNHVEQAMAKTWFKKQNTTLLPEITVETTRSTPEESAAYFEAANEMKNLNKSFNRNYNSVEEKYKTYKEYLDTMTSLRQKKFRPSPDERLAFIEGKLDNFDSQLIYSPTPTPKTSDPKSNVILPVQYRQDGGKMDTNFLLKPGTEIDTSSITNKLNPIVFAQLHKAMRGNKNQFAKLQK